MLDHTDQPCVIDPASPCVGTDDQPCANNPASPCAQGSEEGVKQIAYWPDGFWTDDLEAAELTDAIEAFGDARHTVVDVPEGIDIDTHIHQLCGSSMQV